MGHSPELSIVLRLCALAGRAAMQDIFDTCCDDATAYRKAVNHLQCGWINAKMFRVALSHVRDGLPLAMRKDVHKAIEQYCRVIDRDGDGVVEIALLDLFLRKVG